MSGESAQDLRLRLRALGLSEGAISAVWPRWWSEAAEDSPSARAELRFGVARRLGLDPHSLLEERDEPRFLWREEARFKHLSGESERERAGITSFGRAVASILVGATPPSEVGLAGVTAHDLRENVLAGRPFVTLGDLLSISWGLAVPVIHLRVYPWGRKRMAAMAATIGRRSSVLLGKDSAYPATIAFYVAHELGHIALEHIAYDQQIVDLEDDARAAEIHAAVDDDGDDEEREADAFALELLTGEPEPTVLPTGPGRVHGAALAHAALESGPQLRIEPGTLALSFGHSTGDWRTASAALRRIYPSARPVWTTVNEIARQQLELNDLPIDALDFLSAVLGEAHE